MQLGDQITHEPSYRPNRPERSLVPFAMALPYDFTRRSANATPRIAIPMKGDDLKEARKKAALDYHEFPTPGKLSITATKQLLNQSDLALAYSPGVAAACEAIVEDPLNVFR